MRRNTTKVIVARAIAAACAGILTVTAPMSALAAENAAPTESVSSEAKAVEKTDEQQREEIANDFEGVTSAKNLDSRSSDSIYNIPYHVEDAAYTDHVEEITNVIMQQPSAVLDMKEHVEAAQQALDDADETLKVIDTTLSDLNKQTGAGSTELSEEAASEVTDAITAKEIPTQAATDAEAAANTVPTVAKDYVDMAQAASDATKVANTAASVEDALPDTLDTVAESADAKTAVESYNQTVATDQEQIHTDAQKDLSQVDVPATGDAASKQTKDVVEVSSEKAQEAKTYAEEAKTALQAALSIQENEDGSAIEYDEKGKVKNQEIQEAVSEARVAAVKAADAANAASSAVDEAKSNLKKAIDEYNSMAEKYGLTSRYVLLEDTTDTYVLKEDALTLEEAKAAQRSAAPSIADAQDLESDIDTANQKFEAYEEALSDAADDVDAAQTKFDAANKHYEAAADAAKQAVTDVTKAVNSIGEDAATTASEAKAVNDYYVSPAKDALDQATEKTLQAEAAVNAANQKVEDDTALVEQIKKTYDNIPQTVRVSAGEKYDTEHARLQKAVTDAEDAKKENNSKANRDALKAAKKALEKWKKTSRDKYISDAIKAAQKEAQGQYNEASKTLREDQNKATELQNQYEGLMAEESKAQLAYDSEVAAREAFLEQVKEAYKNETAEKLQSTIKQKILDQGIAINQVQFDKDVYEWVNKILNTGAVFEKEDTRQEINDFYSPTNPNFKDWIEDIVDSTILLQWLVGTEKREKIMESVREEIVAELIDNAEKLEVARANLADLETQEINEKALATLKDVENQKKVIDDLTDDVKGIQKKYASELDRYNNAKDKLEQIQKNLDGLKLTKIDLTELQAQIASAQKNVDSAEENLKNAQAAAVTASNFADWADALLNQQQATAYAQLLTDTDNKPTTDKATDNVLGFDQSDATVKAQSTTYFAKVSTVKVPYEIYRNYVELITGNYSGKKPSTAPSGKGIALNIEKNLIYYWTLDEEGKTTGEFVKGTTDGSIPEGLKTGRYFVAYSFKRENDGYHLDGYEIDYTEPLPLPTPETTPEPQPEETEPAPLPSPSPAVTPVPGGDATTPAVTPPDATTPTTSDDTTPTVNVTTETPDAPAVLGVSRPAPAEAAMAETPSNALVGTDSDEPQVLGVSRDEPQVLGVGRNVPTGDEADQMMWAAIAMISAMLLSGWVVLHRRYNK